MKQLIECVPNFSEGNNKLIINKITNAIKSISEVKLLNVEPGKATNRTVVTFVGSPDAVVDAAFLAIKKAASLIDMSKHKGEHPRFGATDVCPLIPIANITMEETVIYARNLAKRVGDELRIPVYCYEYTATNEKRRSLSNCRAGEYEALEKHMNTKRWIPDFGPSEWSANIAKTGATAIGARNLLIAYNINLDTTSTQLAKEIASEIRESGKTILNENGKIVRIPGSLKKVRAIGWYIKEYGKAQVSMNLTDFAVTPVHTAFEEVCKKAHERGIRVTGSEIIGLVPLNVILDAGKYFLMKQQRTIEVSEKDIIDIAIKSLGLDELSPFNPNKKILDYLIKEAY